MRRVYSAVPGGPLKDQDARRLGPVLSALTERLGGRVSPKDVVQEARSPRSVLHAYFDWNDETAANKHRLSQARQLLSHIRIRVVARGGKEIPVRNWFSVRTEEHEGGKIAYVAIERVQQSAFLKEQVVRNALREAESWADRYSVYRELDKIRFAIKDTISTRQKKGARKSARA